MLIGRSLRAGEINHPDLMSLLVLVAATVGTLAGSSASGNVGWCCMTLVLAPGVGLGMAYGTDRILYARLERPGRSGVPEWLDYLLELLLSGVLIGAAGPGTYFAFRWLARSPLAGGS